MKTKPSSHFFINAIVVVLLLVVYVVSGKLGLGLAFVNASATAVWPPTGIALAALLLLGYRYWPVILLGAFLVNRFAGGKKAFTRPADVFKFAFLAGLVATAFSATIGVSTLVFGGL